MSTNDEKAKKIFPPLDDNIYKAALEEELEKQDEALKYKDGNPKTTLGQVKPPMFKVPPIPMYWLGIGHLQGALKYGHYNWRDDPVSISTYIDACERHLNLFKEGERNARDSGIHHLAHAMTCLSIIIDATYFGTAIDDRKQYRNIEDTEKGAEILNDFFENEGKQIISRIYGEWQGHAESKYGNKG